MSTDLFGQPIADPPPMTAPLPWRVYQMNDVIEWVMARSEREAIGCYLEWAHQCGDCRTEDEMRASGHIGQLHELTDTELADEEYGMDGERRSFADELAKLAEHARVPMYFATTEY